MRALAPLLFALLLSACMSGQPLTPRQQMHHDTAAYTQCDYVTVDCVDEDCSNMKGGAWTATACGTKYRCTRAAGHVGCVPINDQ